MSSFHPYWGFYYNEKVKLYPTRTQHYQRVVGGGAGLEEVGVLEFRFNVLLCGSAL